MNFNVGIMFECMICHDRFDFKRTSEVDFLWNDKFYEGKPICKECANLFKIRIHCYNCNITIYVNKPYEKGLKCFHCNFWNPKNLWKNKIKNNVHKHLNYEVERIHIPKGLEKWL